MCDKLIKAIKNSLAGLEQQTLFNDDPEIKLVDTCVNYLKYKGFRVIEPKTFKVNIKNINDLIDYFYLLLSRKHPEKHMTSYNESQDRAIAKRFVDSRIKVTGASKEYALNECGSIIETVINHEEEFKFKFPINFAVFGHNKLRWVTDRAVEILNKNLAKAKEVEAEKLREEAIKSQDITDLGFDDLDDILAKMEEEEDGQKN